MKRFLSLILATAFLAAFFPAHAADGPLNEKASHIHYIGGTGELDKVYSKDGYLYDTLVLAGSGMGGVTEWTVCDLEYLAFDQSKNLGYENSYSLLTSGSTYSASRLTGLRLVDFLLYCGMDPTLPDPTPVRFIAKDGYTISSTLGKLRSGGYSRYSSPSNPEPKETGLPVLLAFGAGGLPLVGPVGDEAVYKHFEAEDGYNDEADNIGGPVRLIFGQTAANEFNAPNCSKWLAAIVVGDADGYVYERDGTSEPGDMSEPESGGDWTHKGGLSGFTLTISGSEARKTTLSLSDIELGMADKVIREYYAASGGKNAFEGIPLKYLVELYTKDGLDRPSKITVVASDGYRKELDVDEVFSGIVSRYQSGKHKDVLLAYAIDGAPLVPDTESEGFSGANAFGPLRLIVENTISAWVKSVSGIILGEEESFTDLDGYSWASDSINYLYAHGVVSGVGGGKFNPSENITRADFTLMLARAYGFANSAADTSGFADVQSGSYYYDAVMAAKALGIAGGDGVNFYPGGKITREDAMTMLYRTLDVFGLAPSAGPELDFSDAGNISGYARGAVTALVGAGIIRGDGARLNPKANMTRAEMAVALCRALTEISQP